MAIARTAEPADFIHKLKLAQKELKESRVWLLFASRLAPGPAVDDLRTESRELLLMIGKSINTAESPQPGQNHRGVGSTPRALAGGFAVPSAPALRNASRFFGAFRRNRNNRARTMERP